MFDDMPFEKGAGPFQPEITMAVVVVGQNAIDIKAKNQFRNKNNLLLAGIFFRHDVVGE